MLKIFITISAVLIVYFNCVAQTNFVPFELHRDSILTVELISPVPLSELNYSVSIDSLNNLSEDELYNKFGNYQYFNSVGYRKINQELIDGFSKLNTKVRYVYRRDLDEKIDNARFIIRCNYLLSGDISTFYFYDTKNKLSYYEFYNAEQLIKAINYAYNYIPTASMLAKSSHQELLDNSLRRSVMKVKEHNGLSRAGQITLGVLTYGVFQTLAIVLSNLE